MDNEGPHALLRSLDGDARPLVLNGDAVALSSLDDCLVEIWGKQGFRGVRVDKYRVLEGTHGLTVWVGRLETRGGELGLIDREGSLFRRLNEEGKLALKVHKGRLVMIEGYVGGAELVRVVYYRLLADIESED